VTLVNERKVFLLDIFRQTLQGYFLRLDE